MARRFVPRWLRNVLLSLAVLAAVVLCARNALLSSAIVRTLEQETGFGVELDKVHVGFLRPVVGVTGLRLVNPEDFPDAPALELNRFEVEYDPRSLFADEVHLRRVLLDVSRAVLVQKEDGETNFQRLGRPALAGTRGRPEPPAASGPGATTSPAPAPAPAARAHRRKRVRVDELTIRMEKAEIRRYTRESPKPAVAEFPLNLERTYRDVADLQQVVVQVAADVLAAQAQEALRSFAERRGAELERAVRQLDEIHPGLGASLMKRVQGAGHESEAE